MYNVLGTNIYENGVLFIECKSEEDALRRLEELELSNSLSNEMENTATLLRKTAAYLNDTDYAAIGAEALIRNGVTVNATDDKLALLAKREEARGYIRKHKELFRQILPKAECPF